ncbi:MAG TPA: hypothetical protein ENN99_04910 [Chloroflexi bacterium]|nr:hypothetical protein [Chloroflexota bacterium]
MTNRKSREVSRLSVLVLLLAICTACSPSPAAPTTSPPSSQLAAPTPTFVVAADITSSEPPATPAPSRPSSNAVTLLLLGADRRQSHEGISNTDTLMIFHLDPDAQRIVVLSIPRDLYVTFPGPGNNQGRINTAYALGKRSGVGGLTLARQTVSQTLDLPVHYAAVIDFHVFVTLVDSIGGVEVDVPQPISDPSYPDSGIGYDPFYLAAGRQHLDGATALKYARTRVTSGGDFDRAARQRQLVLAIRERVTQFDLLPDLVAQSPQLWAALQSAFVTDLTLSQIVDLAATASRIPPDRIVSASIDQTCTYAWTTPAGADVLLLDREPFEALLDDLFADPPTTAAAQ